MKFTELSDGTAQYTTSNGDMVDQIAFNRYGTHEGTTVLVYEQNPGLVEHGLILPEGLTIILPEFVQPEAKPQINLWT